MKLAEARVSVEERGFRFGDGAFETVPVHRGRPYLLHYHIERLQTGLKELGIAFDCSQLPTIIDKVTQANNARECIARIYVSRGAGSIGYLPVTPAPPPTLILQLLPLPRPPEAPVTLLLSRWEKPSPRALPTACKTAQGINSTLARMEAQAAGHYEALQLNASGHIAEASSANIFWLKGKILYTPSLATGALAGVTRRRIMELTDIPCLEGEFTLADLRDADAVFLTNAATGVMAVQALAPLGMEWDSETSAAHFSAMRQADIES